MRRFPLTKTFRVYYSTGDVEPFVQGFIHRQAPVHLSNNAARVPGTRSQLSAEGGPHGAIFLQDEAQVTWFIRSEFLYISMFKVHAKSRVISPDAQPTRLKAEMAKIRGYSVRSSRIIVLLFNTLITKHSFTEEKQETISILSFFSPTHKITYIAGYLLTADDENSVHHNHILAPLQCVES